jgi:hypothetical protein
MGPTLVDPEDKRRAAAIEWALREVLADLAYMGSASTKSLRGAHKALAEPVLGEDE